jgi:hypothetical protein
MAYVSVKGYASGNPVPILDGVFHYQAPGTLIDQFFNSDNLYTDVLLPVGAIDGNANQYDGGNFTYDGVGLSSIPALDIPGSNQYNVFLLDGQYNAIIHYLAGIGYEEIAVTLVFADLPDLPPKCVFKPKAMSYTEYLRSKKSASVKIIDTKPVRTASEITNARRLGASTVFALNNQAVKGSITTPIDFSQGGLHAARSYFKQGGAGRRVGSASEFTAFSGSQAIGGLVQAGLPPTRLSQPSNLILVSSPVTQGASDYLRRDQGCKISLGQQHDLSKVTPAVFVDDTIRNTGSPACVTRPAIHDIKDETAFPQVPNRPSQAGGQYALKGDREPGKELGEHGGKLPTHLKINKPITTLCSRTGPNPHYKAGAAIDNIPYVEKHHGNDLGVNPKRPFVKFQIPKGATPVHLKINKPINTI